MTIQSLSFYDSSSSGSAQATDGRKKKKRHKEVDPQNISLGHGQGSYPKVPYRERSSLVERERPLVSEREMRQLEREAIEAQRRSLEESFHGHPTHLSERPQLSMNSSDSWWQQFTSQPWWMIAGEALAAVGAVGGVGYGGVKLVEHWKVSEKLPSFGESSKISDKVSVDNNTPNPSSGGAPTNSTPPPVRQPKPARVNHQWSADSVIKAAQETIYQQVDRAENPLIAGLKENVPAIPFVSSKTERAAKQIDDYEGTDQTAFKGLLLHLVDAMIEENRYSDCQRLIDKVENGFKTVSLERVRTVALTKLKVDHWGSKPYKDKEIKGIAEILSCIPVVLQTNEDKLHIRLCNGLIAENKTECKTPFAGLIPSLGAPTDPKGQLHLYYAKVANELKPPETDLTTTLTTHADLAIKQEALLLAALRNTDTKLFAKRKDILMKLPGLDQKVKDLIIKRVSLLKLTMDKHKIDYASSP